MICSAIWEKPDGEVRCGAHAWYTVTRNHDRKERTACGHHVKRMLDHLLIGNMDTVHVEVRRIL